MRRAVRISEVFEVCRPLRTGTRRCAQARGVSTNHRHLGRQYPTRLCALWMLVGHGNKKIVLRATPHRRRPTTSATGAETRAAYHAPPAWPRHHPRMSNRPTSRHCYQLTGSKEVQHSLVRVHRPMPSPASPAHTRDLRQIEAAARQPVMQSCRATGAHQPPRRPTWPSAAGHCPIGCRTRGSRKL